MSDYGQQIARHYAAYRPALHELILSKVLKGRPQFQMGLDVGCGTGRSTVALKQHCEQVLGIDPSREMLEQAVRSPGISYQWFDGNDLSGLPKSDFITFAGAWMYARSQNMIDQLARLATDTVLLYDFEVLLSPSLQALSLSLAEVEPSGYDHSANFAPYDSQVFSLVDQQQTEIEFEVTHEQLAHLLLADQGRYEELSTFLATQEPFQILLGRISSTFENRVGIPAHCYWSRYSCRS